MNQIKFKDFITLQRGFDLPKSQMVEGEYPVVGSTTIIGYHNKYKKEPPGVVTGRSGSLGTLQYITKRYWPHNTSLWVKDFKGNVPRYVYYFLQTLPLPQYNAGAGVPTLNRNHLNNLNIQVHGLNEQQKITSILSAYDSLIENNTRRIRILEEMAQLIYQEWFVNSRFPGNEKVRFINSEIGQIPEGWTVASLGDVIEYHIGGGWGEDERVDKYIIPAYVIRGTDIPNIRLNQVDSCPLRYHTESNFQSRELCEGDIIFEVSGGSKDQPLGRTLFMNKNVFRCFNFPIICASFCKLIRIKRDKILPELLFLKFLEMYNDGSICKYQVQSTGISNFKFSYFLGEEKVVIPPHHVQKKFREIVSPIFDKIYILGEKNTKLKMSRDILLPKLISGELDVSNLEFAIREQEE